MFNKLSILLLATILTSCVVKNYESKPPAESKTGATIQWKDGSQTQIKPPVIENRP